MQSAIHKSFAEPADVMELADTPVPEPSAGQVRIRTILSPIHNHDVWTVRGSYGYKPELPAIGGSEGVGLVDALGEGVTHLKAGQRIAVAGVHGTWAEYFLAPAASVIPVPDAIPDESAAQLVAMPFSAISLLEDLEVSSGDWIVQNTANGAVGKAVAMLAAARGVNVLGIVRREAGVAELAALGIGNVVSSDSEGWQDRARAILNGAKPVAGVDSVGSAAATDICSLLADGGTFVCFGSMSSEPLAIPAGDLIFRQIKVRGFWGAKTSAEMPKEKMVELITELMQRVAAGKLLLPVSGIYPLSDVREAMRATMAPGKSGKVLLRP